MKRLTDRITSSIDKYSLLGFNDRVLIALSGGPDSVALFHLLGLLADKYNISLAAAHVNHCLREDADQDQKFCRQLCRAYGYKFHSRKANIKAYAKKHKMGLEEAGRLIRYDFFQSLSEKHGYLKIATGHTADDSAETFLLNLVRGADLGGLGGIPSKRDNIIRPLIEISKADILAFLKENRLTFMVDKSNLSDIYKRNLIRNKVVPALKRINAGALDHISRAGQNLRTSYEYLEAETGKLYDECLVKESNTQIILDLGKLPAYHKSLKSWILLRAYFRLTGDLRRPGSDKIEQAINLLRSGSQISLDSSIIVSNHAGKLILCRPLRPIKRIRLKNKGKIEINGSCLKLQIETLGDFDLEMILSNDDENTAYLDKGKTGELSVRGFKDGDRFRPLGMKGLKKLSDYLNDKGVPLILKKSIPIVISGKEIAWIAGYGISEIFKVTDKTKRVLKLQLINSERNR